MDFANVASVQPKDADSILSVQWHMKGLQFQNVARNDRFRKLGLNKDESEKVKGMTI